KIVCITDLLTLEIDDDVVRESRPYALEDARQKDCLARALLATDSDHHLCRFFRHKFAHDEAPLLLLSDGYDGRLRLARQIREANPQLPQPVAMGDEVTAIRRFDVDSSGMPEIFVLPLLPGPLEKNALPRTEPVADLFSDGEE